MDQHTPWQATYLRRREWVRTIIRGVALLIALLGSLGLYSFTGAVIGAAAGMSWMNILATIGAPLTYFSVAFALGWFSTRLSRWIVPLPEPGCPRCGYSLKDLRSPICPECGLDLRPAPSDRSG